MFIRPCFLVVDHEFAGSISTRKLVLETGKFNVITAYSYAEAQFTMQRFPNIDACIVNATGDGEAEELLAYVREAYPGVKLVITGYSPTSDLQVDLYIENYSPGELLEGLRRLFPVAAATVDTHERELEGFPPAGA